MLGLTFFLFLIMLLIGVPIAFAMGAAASLGIFLKTDVSLTLIIQRMFAGVDSFSLMAIPFYMLAGELMETGGISRKLVNFSKALVGHLTGGLGMVAVVTNIIFAGISGSAAADTAAVGSILIPSMKREGYPKGLPTVLLACSGSLGPIIPPSLTMIIFGSLTGVSIGALFISGIIPGILIGIGLMLVTYYYAKKYNLKGDRKATFKEFLNATKDASLALILPVIIVGGITTGVFTATEAGAVAVVYAFVVGCFIYKEYQIKDIPRIIIKAAGTTSMAMLIIAGASILSWIVAYGKLPTYVIQFLTSITTNKYVILLLLEFFLLIVGMFIETISATIICAPILMPVAAQFGVDPIHFALIMVITLVYAGVTPPVGGVLYISMAISGAKMKDVFKFLPAYVFAMGVVIVSLVFFPQLATFLPKLVGMM